MDSLNNICVVLPSLDPDEKLLTVIDGLLSHGFCDIVLVNDGSKPENIHYFETAAQHKEVHLLHHPQNRGKGAALKTAFTWVLENRPDCAGVVTVDGDNQHHPEDTAACVRHMAQSGRITLGVRDFDQADVPPRSRFGNKTTSLVFKFFVGMTISDTQTGLRAIPIKDLPLMISISGDRFEYETNMLLAIKENRLDFDEVKIRTVYIEENQSSHFRVIRDSWRIYKLILAHFFRYTASSLISSVVDEGIFVLLSSLLQGLLSGFMLTAVATAGARITSSLLNFCMNKRLVFRSNVPTGKAIIRYYALAIPIALAQMLLTHGVYSLLHIGAGQVILRAVIYAVVMVVLYLVSFLVQQRWVFAKDKNDNP